MNNDSDNCPQDHNPYQTDIDEDGLGDVCDAVDDRGTGGGESGGGDNGACSLSPEDQDMLATVNAVRAQARQCGARGFFPAVQPLAWNCKLEAAALAHSRDMAERNFFDHYGSNGSNPGNRMTLEGYIWSTYGENIAAGLSLASVGAVVQGWVDSDGHCANLMNPGFYELGAAKYSNNNSAYKLYWTQVFGRQH